MKIKKIGKILGGKVFLRVFKGWINFFFLFIAIYCNVSKSVVKKEIGKKNIFYSIKII